MTRRFHCAIIATLGFVAGCWNSAPKPMAVKPPTPPPQMAPAPQPAVEPPSPIAAPEAKPEEPAAKPAEEPQAPPPPERIPGERLLVLTAGGPLIVEAAITIDGKPFLTARDQLVDELLKLADSDKDGTPTWAEAMAAPRFAQLAAMEDANETPQKKEERRKTYDRNLDGQMSRNEAERFLARGGEGAAFTLSQGQFDRLGASRVRELVDADLDLNLSVEELAALEQRLKQRDRDANEMIDSSELLDTAPAGPEMAAETRNDLEEAYNPRAMLLGARPNWPAVFYSLNDLFVQNGKLTAGSFPALPALFGQLDLDENGVVDKQEIERLNRIPAHLELTIRYGAGQKAPQVIIDRVAPELGNVQPAPLPGNAGWMLDLAGIKLRLTANDQTPPQDTAAAAKQAIEQLDKDKNGYLEDSELPEGNPQLTAESFAAADKDGDKKLYQPELAEYLVSQQQPTVNRLRAAAAEPEDPYFWVMDANADGRLSPRELRGAAERLKSLDANGDGRLAGDEILTVVLLSFDRGPGNAAMNNPPANRAVITPPPVDERSPRWFVGMDRNGDQDLSPGEFLGTPAQFDQLDANRDGFIDPGEAQNASGSPSPSGSGTE